MRAYTPRLCVGVDVTYFRLMQFVSHPSTIEQKIARCFFFQRYQGKRNIQKKAAKVG